MHVLELECGTWLFGSHSSLLRLKWSISRSEPVAMTRWCMCKLRNMFSTMCRNYEWRLHIVASSVACATTRFRYKLTWISLFYSISRSEPVVTTSECMCKLRDLFSILLPSFWVIVDSILTSVACARHYARYEWSVPCINSTDVNSRVTNVR